MGRSERELVTALRAELAAIDPSRPCDRRAEAAGLGAPAPAREGAVARLAVRLARERRAAVQEAAGPFDPAALDWPAAADHCRMAWLRGLFLARGSLSLAGGRTHLEFVVPPEHAADLVRRLADVELPSSWRIRRGRGVVTWKSGDTVGLFLRRIGAAGALLELEARQVSRAMRGDLNRVINAESANVQRAVGAAGRQIAAIAELEEDGRLAEQTYVVRSVAADRRETPEATLAELADRLGIHRSAVQRALERIERLVLHPDAGPRRSGGSSRRATRSPRAARSGSPAGAALA
ncbi:MAG TPA: DNA-binding protein WhiA [Candidatus Limnocylindrales bacterium]|nr:DNA-binding protein WhiA [Candidatus Limnocylindrales bacterium]